MTVTVVFCPAPILQFFGNDGKPLIGGSVLTQVGGVNYPTYQDPAGATPLPNPIPLNSRGEVSNAIGTSCQLFLQAGVSYTFTLFDASSNQVNTATYVAGPPIPATQASIGALLWPQTQAELVAGVTPTNYVWPPGDIRRYGADPTGIAASDTALSSAISVCGTTGGTIRLPNGKYTFASQINLNQKTSIILQGDGAATGGGQPATQIVYTASGSGIFITMLSAIGVQIRDCQIVHNIAGYTGTYIKCGNDGSHGDPAFCGVFNCVIGTSVNGVGNLHLDLDKCNLFTAQNCNFIYGNPSIRGQASAGGSYSNVNRFRDCRFGSGYIAPIANGGQSWVIESCNFEALNTANNPPGGLFAPSSSTFWNGLKVIGCWFGDAGTGAGTWIDIYTQAAEISGNYISGNATGSTGITLRQSFGVQIVGNTFSSLLNGIFLGTATCNDIVFKANVANTVTNPWASGNNAPTGGIDFGPNFGFGVPGTNHGLQAQTGYRVNADGTVEQWGFFSATVSTSTVTFPLAFPSTCYNVQATLSGVGSTSNTIYVASLSTTTFTYTIGAAFTNPTTFYWRAVGK